MICLILVVICNLLTSNQMKNIYKILNQNILEVFEDFIDNPKDNMICTTILECIKL